LAARAAALIISPLAESCPITSPPTVPVAPVTKIISAITTCYQISGQSSLEPILSEEQESESRHEEEKVMGAEPSTTIITESLCDLK